MANLKNPIIGVYGPKTRDLQKRLSFERISLTWKTCNVYKYLGSRTNATPSIDDIADPIFLETPDRAYATTPIEINVWHERMQERVVDLSQFGILNPMGNEQIFKFHVLSFEADGLGRYLIEGDVLEIPFLQQDGEKAFFEITDVNRKTEFENFYVYVTATNMNNSRETAEIPDKNTSDTVYDNIETEFNAEVDSQVSQDGVDEGNVTVENPSPDDPYDPREDDVGDFLDDPNKKVF